MLSAAEHKGSNLWQEKNVVPNGLKPSQEVP